MITRYLNKYDEVERQRSIAKERAGTEERRAAEQNRKFALRSQAVNEWNNVKETYWGKALEIAERRYGRTLESINKYDNILYDFFELLFCLFIFIISFGAIPLLVKLSGNQFFPKSRMRQADIMRNELFTIRDEEFKRFRRGHFYKYDVTYPFDDS